MTDDEFEGLVPGADLHVVTQEDIAEVDNGVDDFNQAVEMLKQYMKKRVKTSAAEEHTVGFDRADGGVHVITIRLENRSKHND